ncbi:RecF/RecN/SMC [Peziza echinospora]|nr:RecF/RecN/SMC [Peziza echinospora]
MGKLVRLELFNFKSYKGHQSIDFGDSYFTSIIGPNGSGKSNCMDAISFVLGIKSSQLRSAHLRDLIYRGRVLRTDIEAAQAAAGDRATKDGDDEGEVDSQRASRNDPKTAWVMAVYENDDGEEQQWKRSITSAGSSEYRINNRLVTAVQYNTALEGENISIKARNFLVFQGDVEAIASQSPKDLTKLIEQISGSLEYKAEYDRLKIESEKATETSTFNLNRRRGINAEIKQYQEQKKEAENYATKIDERDEVVVTHILWKLFHFQQVMNVNKEEIEKEQAELMEIKRNHDKCDQKLDQAKKEQARAMQDASRTEREIRKKERELEERETSLVPVDEKINIATKKLKSLAGRVKDIERDKESEELRVAQLEKDLAIVDKAQKKFETEQKKLAEQTGTVLSDADLAEYNKLRERVNTRIAAEQIKVDNYTRQQKTDEESVNSLKSKLESTQYTLANVKAELAEMTERKERITNQVSQISQEIDNKKREYNTITSERLRQAQKHTELEEKLAECGAKLLEVDDGRQQNQRQVQMRETIATLKRIFPGVKGRISDLCKPKLKKYNDAVSTVLGRHFDAVVVDTDKTAKDCIEYLREQKMGQATFYPLETIQNKPINSNLKGMHRGMRMAIDTIEYDASVDRAMQHACGNSVVCDDLAVAKYICYEKGLEVRAVTLDGTVIHKGGLMTGGYTSGRGQRRFEDQEVEGLRRLKENLLAQIEALPNKNNRRGAQEETLQGELTGLEQQLEYLRNELRILQRDLAAKSKEVTHTETHYNSLLPKLREATASLEALQARLAEHQTIVSSAEDEVFAEFCRKHQYENIRIYEQRQGSIQAEFAQRKLEFAKQKSKLESQLSFEKQRLKSTSERIENLENGAKRDRRTLEELEAEKEQIQEEMDLLGGELDILKETLATKQSAVEKRVEKVNELRRELSKRNEELKAVMKTIVGLEAEIERNTAGRYAILRRCKLEGIKIPLTDESSSLEKLPIEDTIAQEDEQDPEAMDVDEEEDPLSSAVKPVTIKDYGIEVDFHELSDDLRESAEEKIEEELLDKIKTLSSELDRMAPNMKAIERLEGVESRLHETDAEFERTRKEARVAKEKFQAVKEKRYELFNKAFTHISEQIASVYKDLTKSATFPLGGQAYLDLEATTDGEPYLDGIKYHATPPTKRFRDMEHLSGGEKTMAALALLFAVHSFHPSPFFVLDEVDAALDNANVAKLREYIRNHAAPGFQFVVISLKTGLFQGSQSLVGIYRDQAECSSRCLTLDLRKYVEA